MTNNILSWNSSCSWGGRGGKQNIGWCDITENENCHNNKAWNNSAKGSTGSVEETLQKSVYAKEYLQFSDMDRDYIHLWSDNKVRELATVCLPWQHWTKALVWFDDVTYQRFTAVLLLIYGSLFLSGIYYCLRVFWCAAARMSGLQLEQRTNIKFLVVSWCWC